jgi:hypothetical protein
VIKSISDCRPEEFRMSFMSIPLGFELAKKIPASKLVFHQVGPLL